MEHISNMGYSLDAIKYIVELEALKGFPSIGIYYKETYPFCDEVAYKQEVEEYVVKHSNDALRKILKLHLSTCEQIVKIWEEKSRLMKDEKKVINLDLSYEIHCVLEKTQHPVSRFCGHIILLVLNSKKKEIERPCAGRIIPWRESDSELLLMLNAKDEEETMTNLLVVFAKRIKSFLSKYVSNEERSQTIKRPQQQLIPDNILNKLQREGFIEDAKNYPLTWTKSKSLLAYFVDVANDKLGLKHGEKRKIKPFETMFDVTGLTGSINDCKNKGQLPIGYKVIDEIFDNILI